MCETERGSRRVIVGLTAVLVAGACGGGGGGGGGGASTADVGGYLQGLPSWSEFSPPQASTDPTPAGPTTTSSEQVQKAVDDGYVSQQYFCKTTPMSMTSTPEKIVVFSPDRELLWPGALLQGKSHRDGLGSLTGLPIRERAPLRVSIPSFATADNFRVVELPDQASVNSAIGDMVASATTAGLASPSSIDFTLRDYKSDKSFALQAGLSGRYMGFSGSASGSVDTAANEQTVMVHFVEKMFEVVVEPPQTPGAVFSEAFTQAKVDFKLDSRYQKTLSEAKIAITSIGGTSTATVGMIASGNWRDYFAAAAPLTSAYPISYTFRNLGDGSIAKVSEATTYDVKECEAAGGANFVLDSFEAKDSQWTVEAASPGQPVPISVAWRDAATQQAIFYGYQAVTHVNRTVDDPDWIYDVGYLEAPDRFKGTKSAFYGGELSFWYKPAERKHRRAGNLLCPDDPRGCWMVEDRAATEDEIRYVLSDVTELRIRASYPVYRTYEGIADPVPLGFVGGYFDEIKLTRPTE